MRLAANDKLLLCAFAALATASVGLKAVAGPPRDGWSEDRRGEIAARLRQALAGQGFATSVIPYRIESPIVLGALGPCRISVRDARAGKAVITQFAQDAASIGPVRYLYKGRSYDAPPTFEIRVGRLKSELVGRFGGTQASIPVAIARSSGCGSGNYGVGDLRIPA